MSAQEHQQLEKLFSTALEKGTWAERSAYLDGACGEDTALRTRVEELLKGHEKASSFLESPPVDPNATMASPPPAAEGSQGEQRIGRYRLLEVIGEGGFGTVHLAEQEVPVRRKVALKIIKLGMDTKQIIARFEAERQALALMDHVNIARVLDAGATTTGRPYFVMELVNGVNITEFCDSHQLSVTERLELFLPVCQAVQHAHQKGIIHRDLKPSNVLVTMVDGESVPKIIDFGIAKATRQRLTDRTLHTEQRQFVGTPEYMSPDQADLSGLDVDTRTDIYSLGVMLYELLTGTTPFKAKELREKSYEEIRRIIREDDPPAPSTRLQTVVVNAQRAEVAKLRSTEPEALPKRVRGDLDWIVLKAMEKDRTRRYETAKDLSDDIQRHLNDQPVVASPPGVRYKAGKFIRRHRIGVLAGSVVGLAIIVGMSLAMVGLVQANKARREAEDQRNAALTAKNNEQIQRKKADENAQAARDEAQRSATMNTFLQEMLSSVDPRKALGREVTIRYVLDQAAQRIQEGALTQEEDVEAEIRGTLGETYFALGEYEAAETHLSIANALCHEHHGESAIETLRSNRVLAALQRAKGRASEAVGLLRPTLAGQREALGREHVETLATMHELGLALRELGETAEAESVHRQALTLRRAKLGETHVDTIESMTHLGEVCRILGKTEEAKALLNQALDAAHSRLGEEHPHTTAAMNHLGRLMEDELDYVRAEELYRRSLEVEQDTLGLDHPRTLLPMNNLMRILRFQGKTTELRPLIAKWLERLQRATERESNSAYAWQAYAWELLNCEIPELRDAEAALPAAERAVELDHGRDAGFLETLAQAYQLNARIDDAVATQRRAIDSARLGGPHNRSELERQLSEYLLMRATPADVMAATTVSLEGVASRLGASLFTLDASPDTAQVNRAIEMLEEDNFRDARDTLEGALSDRQKRLNPDHWLIGQTRLLLGVAIAGQGDFSNAEQQVIAGFQMMQQHRLTPNDQKYEALRRVAQFYDMWNKPQEAMRWREQLPQAAHPQPAVPPSTP